MSYRDEVKKTRLRSSKNKFHIYTAVEMIKLTYIKDGRGSFYVFPGDAHDDAGYNYWDTKLIERNM